MQIKTKSRADWRVLTCAALVGTGMGLGLGATYLAAGMAGHAAEHARSVELAEAATGGYEAAAWANDPKGSPPEGVARLLAPQPSKARIAAGKKAARRSELDCLASAVYYEARGEGASGQAAVAQVVMNRVHHPAFPKTVCGVVFQGAGHRGCQFSFACDGSMGRHREANAWTRARRIAAQALAGVAVADVGRATHFHTTGVAPAWGPQMNRVAQVGMHIFYKFNPKKKSGAAPVETVLLTAGPAPSEPLQVLPAVEAAPLTTAPAPAEAAQAAAKPAEPAPAPKASTESAAAQAPAKVG